MHRCGQPVPAPIRVSGSVIWTWTASAHSGSLVATILERASGGEHQLIVMATHGHDGVLDALQGSLTEQVLRAAPCPVLSVPA